ncbi:MAG: PASTA domain-containing protein [Clostridia bacterium]|nr:PASTA domain-containing protein [Clostridia bacterium]
MAKGPTKQMWKRTLIVLLVVIILGFGTCGVSLSNIMLVKADKYRTLAEQQQLRDVVVDAKRGTIYDASMNVLAASSTVWQVYITPSDFEDDAERQAVAKGLAEILQMDYEKVYKITCKKTGYETVGKTVTIDKANQVRAFVSENEFGSIIGLDEATKRYYPNDNLASTVLGFVGTDNQGLNGLEYQYDSTLTGTPGRVISAKNAKGADMPFSYEKVVDAKAGNSLVLTIDEYIQHVAEKYLDQAVIQNGVKNRGCCIVMDVNTGGVLAMATKPDYNPNEPFTIYDAATAEAIAKLTGDERSSAIAKAQQEQWRNKCVSDVYEPGSVFKIITGSAALDEGKTSMNASFSCPGYIVIANRRISCHKHEGHGTQNLTQAFMNSCNPAFITIGQSLGVTSFTNYRKSFGLQTISGIDLPGESEPIYHVASKMGPVELASESFGQTFKITPIQFITAISAAVNGGYLYKPHIVKQVLDENGNIIKNMEGSPIRQVISEETSKKICDALEAVVSEGTGKNAYVPGYRVGGKTGTSQKIDTQNEEGEINKYIASFCGIAPTNEPKIAILMLLDEPSVANPYGGTLVAPMVGKMFEEILPYMGVTPQYSEDDAEKIERKTPDVMGKTVEKAKDAIREAGLSFKVVGDGDSVVRQVPSAYQTIPKGGTVVIYTENDSEKKTVKVPDFIGMTVSQANSTAINMGLNIKFSGSTTNAVAYNQSVEKDTEVEIGTVITVEFRENIVVE